MPCGYGWLRQMLHICFLLGYLWTSEIQPQRLQCLLHPIELLVRYQQAVAYCVDWVSPAIKVSQNGS